MKTKEIFQYLLAGAFILFFFICMSLVILYPMPAENENLIMLSFGTLFGIVNLIAGYFFGSSIGSSKKTDIMNQQPKP
jgi:hypothetical protein